MRIAVRRESCAPFIAFFAMSGRRRVAPFPMTIPNSRQRTRYRIEVDMCATPDSPPIRKFQLAGGPDPWKFPNHKWGCPLYLAFGDRGCHRPRPGIRSRCFPSIPLSRLLEPMHRRRFGRVIANSEVTLPCLEAYRQRTLPLSRRKRHKITAALSPPNRCQSPAKSPPTPAAQTPGQSAPAAQPHPRPASC